MAQRTPTKLRDAANENGTEAETPLDDMTAAYVPRTDLGRRLMAIRERIVQSGVPLLDWDEVEREVASRRGGIRTDDTH